MLSFVTSADGDVVFVHADAAGLEVLEEVVSFLKRGLEKGECEHDHLFTEVWGGRGLCESMLKQEREEGGRQVHHVKFYAWTPEWKEKYGL